MRILIFAITALVVICLTVTSIDGYATTGDILKSYDGNLSERTLRNMSMYQVLGPVSETVAITVKFNAPWPKWNLKNVTIYGWDGYRGTIDTIPKRGLMVLEIRDQNLNLLYRFTDIQTPYTNYVYNVSSVLFPIFIDLPSIPVTKEFYVCFYDRGVVSVGFDFINSTTNSYFYDRGAGMLLPANLPPRSNNTVEWLMKVGGN